jgi:hypothetical protein
MNSVWVLFAVYSDNAFHTHYTYFKGVFQSYDDAMKSREELIREHPEFMFFVKEATFGELYNYGWSNGISTLI